MRTVRRSTRAAVWLLCVTAVSILCGCGVSNGYVMNQSGQAFYKRGRFAEARDEFKRAAADHPGNPSYLSNLALSMKKQGDLAGAERTYRHAINIDPSHQPSYHGLAHLMLEQNRTDEAQSVVQSWVGSQPYSAEPHVEMAWIQRQLGNRTLAAQSLQNALRVNPNHPSALAQLGQHYQDTGQLRLAGNMYKRSLRNNWYQPHVHKRLQAVEALPAYAPQPPALAQRSAFLPPAPAITPGTPSAPVVTDSTAVQVGPQAAVVRFPNADPAHAPQIGPDVAWVSPF